MKLRTSDLNDVIEYCLSQGQPNLRIAIPLGLGKPNRVVNALYGKFKESPSRKLEISTALSLDVPVASSDLEKRFLNPFLDRHFGKDYPRLEYVKDLKADKLPSNIRVFEFYSQAAAYLNKATAQADYISLNYTHVAQALLERGIDVLIQLVSPHPTDASKFSLSCNSDLTLDVRDLYRAAGRTLKFVAVVHPDLPYLGGDAEIMVDDCDLIFDDPNPAPLFALPLNELDAVDHMIGFHGSQLVKDDGTLQIGIGSLSDALVSSLIWRHEKNEDYQKAVAAFQTGYQRGRLHSETSVFTQGLYGTSEMMMDGFMHLRKAGILKREIFDLDESQKRYMHAAFFLGSKDFYQWLRELSKTDFDGLSMTRVSKVNDLYDPHELALRRQRKNARFFNTCMKVSVLGGAMSDTLNDGQVISGIGGQYNFVAMSQELPDSHSVLMLRSRRKHQGRLESNIANNLTNLSIPRHLRDVVITEYGVAALKGRTDQECIQDLIQITDTEFQDELVDQAKAAHKLQKDYRVPEFARANRIDRLEEFVQKHRTHFPAQVFGTDFTPVEEKLKPALLKLKAAKAPQLLKTIVSGAFKDPAQHAKALERMDLQPPKICVNVCHVGSFWER